tara:strand:+ start:7246 stop:8127 length:882 start_codon:yes stop_codon:yes gene_type:complete
MPYEVKRCSSESGTGVRIDGLARDGKPVALEHFKFRDGSVVRTYPANDGHGSQTCVWYRPFTKDIRNDAKTFSHVCDGLRSRGAEIPVYSAEDYVRFAEQEGKSWDSFEGNASMRLGNHSQYRNEDGFKNLVNGFEVGATAGVGTALPGMVGSLLYAVVTGGDSEIASAGILLSILAGVGVGVAAAPLRRFLVGRSVENLESYAARFEKHFNHTKDLEGSTCSENAYQKAAIKLNNLYDQLRSVFRMTYEHAGLAIKKTDSDLRSLRAFFQDVLKPGDGIEGLFFPEAVSVLE